MKVLFTGASSFTGYWFVRELVEAGHEVAMTFQRGADDYEGVRKARVELLRGLGRAVHNCSFGDERFMVLIADSPTWDMLCHHAADATNYKKPGFDIATAFANNTRNLPRVLGALFEKGCHRVLLTGSVFEGGEGAGSDGLPAFSPYGVSKELTARAFAYYAHAQRVRLAKFVIPNPFGPYEEPRFTAYLMRSWYEGKAPVVNTPAYVRDNIHVSLLAKAYVDFADGLPLKPGFQKLNPSGYVESQGRFAERFAREMQRRSGLPCELELRVQTEFPEPRIRVNTDPLDGPSLGWDEVRAWDQIGEYYCMVAGRQPGI